MKAVQDRRRLFVQLEELLPGEYPPPFVGFGVHGAGAFYQARPR